MILRSGMRGKPIEWRARLSVFLSSMAMVIGPTPPGTGVMAPATLVTARDVVGFRLLRRAGAARV